MAEVRLAIDLAHPPERAWRALTEARLLGEWFMPTDLEPRQGARFTLEPGTLAGFSGLVSGELTEVAAPYRMVMLWQGEQLYTRVTWELAETGEGCTIRVLQTGFLGAPATPRRRALRDTYTRLFADQLPAVLDRIAAGTAAAEAPEAAGRGRRGGTEPAGRAGSPANLRMPRQRRVRPNVAVGAWSAGRSLRIPAVTGPDPAGAAAELAGPVRSAGSVEAAGAAEPAGAAGAAGAEAAEAAGAAEAAEPVERPGGTAAAGARPSWRGWLATVPGWARTLTIGAAAAYFSVSLLIAAMDRPADEFGLADPGTDQEGLGEAPDGAIQPGAVTSRNSPAHPTPALDGAPGGPPASAGGLPPRGRDGPDPTPDLAPGQDGPPGQTPAGAPSTGPSAAGPVLTAAMTTSGLPLVGARSVEVTVSNPGPASAQTWEVVVSVGDQSVTNVTGAEYRADGPRAVFAPVEPGPGAGETTRFSFEIPAPVPGLAGAEEPSGCTIDGRPCA